MKKFLDTMQKVQIAVGGFFLFVFLLTVVLQMACRYLGIAAMWTEDVSMYSFIWAVFMGAGAMVHSDAHFAFTSLTEAIKNPKLKIALHIFISCVMLIFVVLMVYYGTLATKQFWNYKWINIPKFNRGPTWMCLPICGCTASIYLIGHIIEDLKKIKKGDID
ncbi:TRAP-type transport system, small permease component [Lachnospiraceae bacterium JC7]|nr:TRAP-type transport system, small permease component [Lachnospiraceae bacterium JC7]